ncbi:F0F1 ATP synthase subunit delta [Sphingomonas rhizophila]|uniref:ATP synthase subunit delta n=1 Tax=Sphingomonas rhizophila TaxID=2071607 RepID=A0A7G9SCH5_9SPHN|nr:F0F1 ATP synthase subunit delta [Sphingomonas rhizophila]QNN65550.1 F0F1 ATP synthase subunit delta [Sphingomonas rhizophila]
METSGGIQASLAGRYATALFGLARDEMKIDAVTRSLDSLDRALTESTDFAALVSSPMVGRADAAKAIAALVPTLSIDPTTANFLNVLSKNGRLGELKSVIRVVRQLAAGHRGETTAEVTSARALDDQQVAALKSNLKTRLGRDVAIDARVDPSLLGGIVVRLGSQMIDASIKTKLNTLANAMKG